MDTKLQTIEVVLGCNYPLLINNQDWVLLLIYFYFFGGRRIRPLDEVCREPMSLYTLSRNVKDEQQGKARMQ